MTSRIDTKKLFDFCKIPVDQLENHPDAKVKLKIYPTRDEVYRWVAQDMLDEVRKNNNAGKPTRWILPCGPTKQYPYFVNWERACFHRGQSASYPASHSRKAE